MKLRPRNMTLKLCKTGSIQPPCSTRSNCVRLWALVDWYVHGCDVLEACIRLPFGANTFCRLLAFMQRLAYATAPHLVRHHYFANTGKEDSWPYGSLVLNSDQAQWLLCINQMSRLWNAEIHLLESHWCNAQLYKSARTAISRLIERYKNIEGIF